MHQEESGVLVRRGSHCFRDHRQLFRICSCGIYEPLLGEDHELCAGVWVLDDIGTIGRGDNQIANGCIGPVDQAVGARRTSRKCDHRASRQHLRTIRATQRQLAGENEEQLLVGMVEVPWRADDARFEFVHTGREFCGSHLSADGSNVATRESIRLPAWLREVNRHRTTVAIVLAAYARSSSRVL